jgi:hydroxyacylglutathione hydrolase
MLNVKAFTFNPVQENTFVLYNEQKQCCIIDPGCYFPEERTCLKDFIEKAGLHPVLLLNTHCHFDHVFGNKFVYDTWKLVPHIHPSEKAVLDATTVFAKDWGFEFEEYRGGIVYVKGGETIAVGADKLDIRFVPGHSPGSICFYYEPGGFVIGGDVLFNGSIGRTDLPGGDFATLMNSIQTQFFTLPDETKVYSGHGPVTTIGFEKMNNPFVKMY